MMQVGDLSDVEELLALGAPLNYKDELGLSPILWATCEGHVAVVDRLGKAKEQRAQKKRETRRVKSRSCDEWNHCHRH